MLRILPRLPKPTPQHPNPLPDFVEGIPPSFLPYTPSTQRCRLSDGSDLLELWSPFGDNFFWLQYDDEGEVRLPLHLVPWPVAADGQGYSLVFSDPTAFLPLPVYFRAR